MLLTLFVLKLLVVLLMGWCLETNAFHTAMEGRALGGIIGLQNYQRISKAGAPCLVKSLSSAPVSRSHSNDRRLGAMTCWHDTENTAIRHDLQDVREGPNKVMKSILSIIKTEVNVWYQMLRDNSYAGIVLFFLSFLAGSINVGTLSIPKAVAAMTLGALYIASFDTVNNLVGVEQDRLDKPHRPYAAGLVSRKGMIVRSILAQIAYVAMGAAFNVGWLSLLWVVVGAGGYLTGLDHHHWYKNHIFISVGVIAMMSSGASVAGYTLGSKWWKLVIPFAFSHGTLCSMQDLRDYEGDLATSRQTLAVILGPDNFRRLCMWVHGLTTPILWVWMYRPLFATKPLVASLFLAGTSLNIFRVVRRLATLKEFPEQHNKTYNLYVKATGVAYLSFAWLM